MSNEFDKWILHEDPSVGAGRHHVGHTIDGKHQAEAEQLQRLAEHIHPAPSGETLVPNRCQKLLWNERDKR